MSKTFIQKPRITNEKLEKEIISKFGTGKEITEILLSRGIDNINAAERFLYPDLNNLYDPYLLKGMKDAVARIRQAAENNETVVVYGDYDADGLTSAAILSLYLSSIGANIVPFIPERKNGYGLQKINLEYLAEEFCPDLIITTDCGISAAEEAEYIQNELGIDLIITDHHEPPEVLPACITVNPKADSQQYPFRELSGAGVAFKVVQALGGIKEAAKYIDLAALGTLADCVPLVDENRILTKFGIDTLNTKRRAGIKVLCDALSLSGKLSANDIIMKFIPKINAPGRLDSAQGVLEFFLSDDISGLKTHAEKLLRDNSVRQLVTEEILNDIYAEMRRECSFHKRSLIFRGGWRDGIAGIAAARLKETFYRPSLLFVETKEDLLKGSGRSIKGVDMYKMLSSLSDITEGFGGHAMACGVTLRAENFEMFKSRVEEYLAAMPDEIFEEQAEYDIALNCNNIQKLVKELEVFEPCLPDDRPIFLYEDNFTAKPFKAMSPHINICGGNLEVKGFFNFADFVPVINNGSVKKQLLINLCADNYNGKPAGILTDINFFTDFNRNDTLLKKLFDGIEPEDFSGISTDREVFSIYYRYIKNCGKTADNYEDFYNMLYRDDLSFRQFTACLIVFSEIGLFDINFMPFFVRVNNIKTELQNSPFYQRLCTLLKT